MSILGKEKLRAIRKVLYRVAHVDGAAAECGVYRGGVLRMIAEARPDFPVYGFDTFEGLPAEMWQEGEPHSVGDFSDCTIDEARASVKDLANVELVKGIFPDSAYPLSDLRFAFVHLDLDFYLSTADALRWLLPRMVAGSAIVFDDYNWKHCPGVKRAIHEAGIIVELLTEFQAVYWCRA